MIIELMLLTTLDGRSVYVNPNHIASISEARDEQDPNKLLTGKVHCVLILSNSKLITVEETCDEIKQRLKGE